VYSYRCVFCSLIISGEFNGVGCARVLPEGPLYTIASVIIRCWALYGKQYVTMPNQRNLSGILIASINRRKSTLL
jgi:hypothetical protein